MPISRCWTCGTSLRVVTGLENVGPLRRLLRGAGVRFATRDLEYEEPLLPAVHWLSPLLPGPQAALGRIHHALSHRGSRDNDLRNAPVAHMPIDSILDLGDHHSESREYD